MLSDVQLALRVARVAAEQPQFVTAAKVGLHPVILNQIERGRRHVDSELAHKILDGLSSEKSCSPFARAVIAEARRVIEAEPEQ